VAARKTTPVKTVDELLKSMLVLSRAVGYVIETRAVRAAAKHRLSASKVQVLRLLAFRGGQTCAKVARFLGVTKPAVTQIVDSMVRAKLVTRRTVPEDRREVNLQLSKKGLALFQTIRQEQRHYVRLAMRQAPNIGKCIGVLNDMSAALAQADEAFESFCLQCGGHGDGACVLVGGGARCQFLAYQDKITRGSERAASRR
jgi:DNA-binding MarR family transcriptional regulator